jgi:hypothetical protein
LVHRPRVIALIDGVFEASPSVWHHEILAAMRSGVAVLGGASMGALRAAELHTLGMVGVGRIFESYRDGTWVDDADVAVLHAGPEDGFRSLTVPLVNIRFSAEQARKAKVLTRAQAEQWVQRASEIFYQDRHAFAVLALLGEKREAYKAWSATRDLDLKALDAREVVKRAFALAKAGARPSSQPAKGSSLVRRRRLHDAGLDPREDPKAAELAEEGLRKLLMAGWARSLGIRPPPEKVAEAEKRWRALARKSRMSPDALAMKRGLAPDELKRFFEDTALDAYLLEQSTRWLQDGPSWEEGWAFQKRWSLD